MKACAIAGCVLLLVFSGCARLPGRPAPGAEIPNPEAVMDFATLYGQNCAGCHGARGEKGAAYDIGNPLYQAWVSDAALTRIVAKGEAGTLMPAYAKSAGGFLTDAQITALVRGMRSQWKKTAAFEEQTPPRYEGTLKGDAGRGEHVYHVACARCHQQAAQSITSPIYLALTSDEMLRTLVVAGRPDIGQPDWTGDIPGRSLTDEEVADVVAWLSAQRTKTPGRPYAGTQ